ncbi:hypothetical protein RvY_15293 [Ramazzottius varieornatus]|uniref:Gustatory receptor n=1 Tax=Ramazzottius varieornatus TaxID=947166 RepID=A0A1D1VUE1_RAMVA|nr:hypothetical protein RvY_15293 [Ramazzottius varieornatus]
MSNTASNSLVPVFFLHYLWLCGLYHPAEVSSSLNFDSAKTRLSRFWRGFRSLYGNAMAVLSCTLMLTGVSDYIYYWEYTFTGISDFSMWVRELNYCSQVFLASMVVFLMFVTRKSIVRLLDQFRRADSLMSFPFRWMLAVLAPLWVITWLTVFCFFASYRYWPLITDPLEAYWNSSTRIVCSPDQTFNLPVLLRDVIILTRSYFIVAINIDMSSQLLYVLLIFGMGKGFANILSDIKEATRGDPDKSIDYLSQVLQTNFKSLRVLQSLTLDLNDTFGLMILLNCLRDMICVVALISSLLQVHAVVEHKETPAQYSRRIEGTMRQYYWDFINIITLACAALRTAVCIYCSANVGKIRRLVQSVRNDYEGSKVEADCTRILGETDASTGAISAAGIKYINLEYAVGVFGIWITYGMLIFQTRGDSVRDQDRAKMKDLNYVMSYLENATRNESAFVRHFIQRQLDATR